MGETHLILAYGENLNQSYPLAPYSVRPKIGDEGVPPKAHALGWADFGPNEYPPFSPSELP